MINFKTAFIKLYFQTVSVNIIVYYIYNDKMIRISYVVKYKVKIRNSILEDQCNITGLNILSLQNAFIRFFFSVIN